MRFIVLFAIVASWMGRAAAEQAGPDGLDFFEKKIRPLLAERCFSCHSARAGKQKGNLRLDTLEGALKGGDRGPSLAPGKPDKSLLLTAIRQVDEDLKMPPKGKLSDAQIADIEAWIRKGAVWPTSGPAAEAEARPAGSRHWAFETPKEVRPPALKNPGWVRNPIDAFILARLEEKGLSPAPPADPRTLLRRASGDLTGLPPTAEEIDAFLADASADAFEKAVDRLLASPRYGERWARFWLDIARYADTTDYDVNGAVAGDVRLVHSAHYRDWVIRSLNEDLPYDQFLVRQIAGDQLDTKTDARTLAAMGFLTIGRRFGGNAQDTIDDRLDVICRGTLGLTMGCARCHDHKFDPIPTRDYYSLYGVLQASHEKTVPLPGASKEAAACYDAELKRRNNALLAFQRATGEAVKKQVRSRIADYFSALTGSEEEASVRGLHPLILRAWRDHLAKAKKEFHPVFAAWHLLSEIPPSEFSERAPERLGAVAERLHPRVRSALAAAPLRSLGEVAGRYGALFAQVAASDSDELRPILDALPPFPKAPESLEEYFDTRAGYEISYLKSKIGRWARAADCAPPRVVILEDVVPKENPRIFKRGNPGSPGDAVPRQFLEVLCSGGREPFKNGSGRLEFARAVASPDNPLTARVIVNRVWLQHFGAGLVRTPSDFGLRSEPPSHPALLDLLALEFVREGWSLKKLHRLLMTSNAYRQSSRDDPAARRIDPDNRLLWRMSPRRLDFEALRDSLLAVAGSLDPSMGGPAEILTSQPYSRRRSVYGFVDRLDVPNLLLSFDFANPASHSPQRHATTVPQQALFMMNSPFLLEQARRVAARAEKPGATPKDRLQSLYRLVLGRPASAPEISLGLRFIESAAAPSAAVPTAWKYGFGEIDEATGRVATFQALPCFTGQAWQCRPYLPDPDLGWIMLNATGGRPGDDPRHAVIRRWIAPRSGTLSVRGAVRLLYDADTYKGSIRVRISSSAGGGILARKVEQGEVPMAIDGLKVTAGDSIDFVADCPEQVAYSQFSWSPVLTMSEGGRSWNAETEFGGPPEAPLTAWEEVAQVLLMGNEFVYLD